MTKETKEELLTRWKRDFHLAIFKGYSPEKVFVVHTESNLRVEIPYVMRDSDIIPAIYEIDDLLKEFKKCPTNHTN